MMRSRFLSIGLLALVAVAGAQAQNTPQTAYFRFNEGCGTIAEDLADGSNAALTGDTSWGFGALGRAVELHGSSDYVDTGRSVTLSGDWTIEFWVNYATPTGADYIFGDSTSSGNVRCFVGGVASGVILRGGPIADVDVVGTTPNTWHHIAYSYDDSAGEIVPYLDGVAQAAVAQPTINATITNLIFGGSGGSTSSLDGRLDEFRIWSEERSSSEVSNLNTTQVGFFNALRINGFETSPASSTVAGGCPSTVNFRIGGGSIGAPLILLAGPGIVCNNLPVPWGGSVDVNGAVVIADGLNPSVGLDFLSTTPFEIDITFPASYAGSSGPAVQGIYLDTTNPPFNLRNTNAGQVSFTGAAVSTYTIGDDASQLHVLGGTRVIDYGGVTYTQFYINSNGFVTFNAGDSDFTPSPSEFFNGFDAPGSTTPNPGVAGLWTDLNRGGTGSGAQYSVCESGSSSTSIVEVQYNNQNYWNSITPAGSFSITFERNVAATLDNLITVDYTNLLPHVVDLDQDPLIGVTDGDDSLGTDSTINVSTTMPFLSPGTPNSVMEEFTLSGSSGPQVDISLLQFIEVNPYDWIVIGI